MLRVEGLGVGFGARLRDKSALRRWLCRDGARPQMLIMKGAHAPILDYWSRTNCLFCYLPPRPGYGMYSSNLGCRCGAKPWST